jgi:hypothetical protein
MNMNPISGMYEWVVVRGTNRPQPSHLCKEGSWGLFANLLAACWWKGEGVDGNKLVADLRFTFYGLFFDDFTFYVKK